MTAPHPVSPGGPDRQERLPSAVMAGLAGRCPQCGRGRLFAGLLTVAERCSVCGLDLRKQDAGDGPAVFVIFFLGLIFMPLVFWIEFSFAPAWWLLLLLWPLPVVLVAVALLRPMKGFLVAQQFRHHASDSGTLDYSEGDHAGDDHNRDDR